MASSRMKADEKRAKILRQLIALESNKYCFDCSQRGTTYVNMTIGSYVCTQCSGLLRGLNNPHRVKSVNIATFTNEDMDFLKSRGNDLCRKVWLGLYDRNSSVPEPDPKNSQGLKDFLSMKYDTKRWHVAPTEEMYAEARTLNQSAFDQVEKGGSRSSRNMIPNNNSSKLIIQQPPRSSSGANSATSSTASLSSVNAPGKPPSSNSQPMQKIDAAAFVSSSGGATQAVEPPGRTANLLGDIGGDPFAAPATGSAPAPSNFSADFSAFGGAQPTSTTTWGMTPQPSLIPTQPAAAAPAPAPAAPLTQSSDKYAALAELDGLFGSAPTSAPASQPTSVMWSAPSASQSGTTSGFSGAWGGTTSNSGGAGWGSASGTGTAASQPVFGATPTWSNGNPFGAGAGPASSSASMTNKMGGGVQSANPFMGNPFASAAAPGWTGMGQQPPQRQSPSTAQPASLNGWGSNMAQPMMMGQQPPSQPVSHNPFLSLSNQFQAGAAAPPQQPQPFGSAAASSTNPFL